MKTPSTLRLRPLLALLFITAGPAVALGNVVSFDSGVDVRDILAGLRAGSPPIAGVGISAQEEGRVLLTELKPGARVTLSQELWDQIAEDDSSFSMTTYINGIKIDIMNLRGAIGASAIPGPGLWAAVNTVSEATRGRCESSPTAKALSIVAVRLYDAGSEGASLILDLGGRACIDSISLRIIKGGSRVPDIRSITIDDLEETFGFDAFGARRLKISATRMSVSSNP